MKKIALTKAGASTMDYRETACDAKLLSICATPLLVLYNKTMWVHRPENQIAGCEIYRLPFSIPNNNRIVLKLEHLTKYLPTGSLYDRLYPYLFRHYEGAGYISPESTPLLEGSVGNAGAAFAYTAKILGYQKYTVLLPEDIYPSRIDQIRKLGAEVIFSPKNTAELGYIEIMEDMIRHAWHGKRRLRGDLDRLFPISKVLRVPNEPYARIVSEVVRALVAMGLPTNIDYFLFGVGAGNTISEIGRSLKARQSSVTKVIACEFQEHPFVSLLKKGKRPPVGGSWPSGQIAETISGVPFEKLNLDLGIVDDVMGINASERDIGRKLANEDLGIFAGRPTGGLVSGVLKMAEQVSDKNIFTIVFDSIAKYQQLYEPVWDIDFSNHRIIPSDEDTPPGGNTRSQDFSESPLTSDVVYRDASEGPAGGVLQGVSA